MNVLIIEDELPARAKLESMLAETDSTIVVVGKVGSVKETIEWLKTHSPPDLAFVDVQLSDDHSFEIFRKVPCDFPVIFTTAYDKYLLKSFEYNSIDYLLKPITSEKLQRSLEKVKKLEQHFVQNIAKLTQASSTLARIVVKKGTEFLALSLEDVAYFYSEHKIVFAKNFSGRQFITDKNLSELEEQLSKTTFFRINRKYIANMKAIERFRPDNGRIRIFLLPPVNEDVHVSKETAPAFRTWIGAV